MPVRRQRLLDHRHPRRRHRAQPLGGVGPDHQPRGRGGPLPRGRRRRHRPRRYRLRAAGRPYRGAPGGRRGPAAHASPSGPRGTGRCCPTPTVYVARSGQVPDAPKPYAVALAWTGSIPGRTMDAVLGLDLMTDWTQFRAAAALLGRPLAEPRVRRRARDDRLPAAGAGPAAPRRGRPRAGAGLGHPLRLARADPLRPAAVRQEPAERDHRRREQPGGRGPVPLRARLVLLLRLAQPGAPRPPRRRPRPDRRRRRAALLRRALRLRRRPRARAAQDPGGRPVHPRGPADARGLGLPDGGRLGRGRVLRRGLPRPAQARARRPAPRRAVAAGRRPVVRRPRPS